MPETVATTDFLAGVKLPAVPEVTKPSPAPEPEPAFSQVIADATLPPATQVTTYDETALVKQMAELQRAIDFMRVHLYDTDGRKQYDRFRSLVQDFYLSFTAYTVKEAMRGE